VNYSLVNESEAYQRIDDASRKGPGSVKAGYGGHGVLMDEADAAGGKFMTIFSQR